MDLLDGNNKKLKIALIQMYVGTDKGKNLSEAMKKVEEAARKGAQVICLPECFNSPYGTQYFSSYAETLLFGPTCSVLKEAAKKHRVYLIGGSFPERGYSKEGNYTLFNTSTIWSPEGELLGIYRKMFHEHSKSFMVVETPFCKIGLGISYDLHFPDVAHIYTHKYGCQLLVFPAAFNMTAGPIHWELLARARAVDNQVFVAAVSPASNKNGDEVALGRSIVVDPFSSVIASATVGGEEILYANIDLRLTEEVRQQMPLTIENRNDFYDTNLVDLFM